MGSSALSYRVDMRFVQFSPASVCVFRMGSEIRAPSRSYARASIRSASAAVVVVSDQMQKSARPYAVWARKFALLLRLFGERLKATITSREACARARQGRKRDIRRLIAAPLGVELLDRRVVAV
jgi:hypothetical protein